MVSSCLILLNQIIASKNVFKEDKWTKIINWLIKTYNILPHHYHLGNHQSGNYISLIHEYTHHWHMQTFDDHKLYNQNVLIINIYAVIASKFRIIIWSLSWIVAMFLIDTLILLNFKQNLEKLRILRHGRTIYVKV